MEWHWAFTEYCKCDLPCQESRLAEARILREQEEELCYRLQLDPVFMSNNVVPTTQQLDNIKVGIVGTGTDILTTGNRF